MTRIPLLVAKEGALAQEGKRYEIPEGEGLKWAVHQNVTL